MSAENEAPARRVYAELFGQGKLDLAEELFAADLRLDNGMDPTPTGVKAVHQAVTMLRTALPDLRTTVEDMMSDGDRVAGRWVARGTHQGDFLGIPPTGKKVSIRVIDISRVEDGKIQEV